MLSLLEHTIRRYPFGRLSSRIRNTRTNSTIISNMAESKAQWHDAFPTPSFDTPRMSPETLAEIIQQKAAGVDYIVVDARRNDFENVYIKGAINLPAQSFYPTLPTTTILLSKIPEVIFHCNSCTETGRGPRMAGWYAAQLKQAGITASRAWILDGGIKRFESLYRDNDKLVMKL
ncbi:rhodanese-like domain protein [Rhizoctonia solani AG-3 Rhs1AP]|uniref:Rhodanese-like domain protein n=1 Tax=Rhizoctonia solani AG-3 Rhs1AP TaxID=1086054 RepID=X8IXH2_9AGAM|nr:rhodanese-like domain protein [Rhizoctonia solani AG-3 Rhs1AP]